MGRMLGRCPMCGREIREGDRKGDRIFCPEPSCRNWVHNENQLIPPKPTTLGLN
jgi:DNA-directed RNA polymerase subunit RPC12/RpoP